MDTLIETVRLRNGAAPLWYLHVRRLATSCRALGVPIPTDLMRKAIRQATVQLCAGLSPEDCALQSMPDASPVKWHLAHVTWFFETFVLADHEAGFAPFQDQYWFLFNSYYEAVGPRVPRARRGRRPGGCPG